MGSKIIMARHLVEAREGWLCGYTWYSLGTYRWRWVALLRGRLHLVRFPYRYSRVVALTPTETGEQGSNPAIDSTKEPK